jgi:hypothetical protein
MNRAASALPANLPPRLVDRVAAAAYANVGTTKFDEMVRDGRMPKPRCIDARRVWDVRQLDAAIDELPVAGEPVDDKNPFDEVTG